MSEPTRPFVRDRGTRLVKMAQNRAQNMSLLADLKQTEEERAYLMGMAVPILEPIRFWVAIQDSNRVLEGVAMKQDERRRLDVLSFTDPVLGITITGIIPIHAEDRVIMWQRL